MEGDIGGVNELAATRLRQDSGFRNCMHFVFIPMSNTVFLDPIGPKRTPIKVFGSI